MCFDTQVLFFWWAFGLVVGLRMGVSRCGSYDERKSANELDYSCTLTCH